MVPGKKHVIVSVRSTLIMECPVWINGKVVVDLSYLGLLLLLLLSAALTVVDCLLYIYKYYLIKQMRSLRQILRT